MNTIKFASDVDIDFADREQVISLLDVTPASILRDGKMIKHNTGMYATDIPRDPLTAQASLDYNAAEDRGYVKLDFLNVNLYKQVRDEAHLIELMREPNWAKLYDPDFCAQLMHVNAHYDTLIKMPEAVNTIPRLAMFLAIIRPAKRHLVGKTWKEVAETVWDKPDDDTYNCDSGIEFLEKLSEEQIMLVIHWIDPDFWQRKFKEYRADTEWVKMILTETGL